jgi:hypothetical protein
VVVVEYFEAKAKKVETDNLFDNLQQSIQHNKDYLKFNYEKLEWLSMKHSVLYYVFTSKSQRQADDSTRY